jgi:hypothetical protein
MVLEMSLPMYLLFWQRIMEKSTGIIWSPIEHNNKLADPVGTVPSAPDTLRSL